MRHLIFALVVVQVIGLVRPLLGAAQYLASRSTLAGQRQAVMAALLDFA